MLALPSTKLDCQLFNRSVSTMPSLSEVLLSHPQCFTRQQGTINATNRRVSWIDPLRVPYELVCETHTLMLANNDLIDVSPISEFQALHRLSLANNKISNLHQIFGLAVDLPHLKELSIRGNPISKSPLVREYIITRFEALEVLDGVKITSTQIEGARHLIRQVDAHLRTMIDTATLIHKLELVRMITDVHRELHECMPAVDWVTVPAQMQLSEFIGVWSYYGDICESMRAQDCVFLLSLVSSQPSVEHLRLITPVRAKPVSRGQRTSAWNTAFGRVATELHQRVSNALHDVERSIVALNASSQRCGSLVSRVTMRVVSRLGRNSELGRSPEACESNESSLGRTREARTTPTTLRGRYFGSGVAASAGSTAARNSGARWASQRRSAERASSRSHLDFPRFSPVVTGQHQQHEDYQQQQQRQQLQHRCTRHSTMSKYRSSFQSLSPPHSRRINRSQQRHTVSHTVSSRLAAKRIAASRPRPASASRSDGGVRYKQLLRTSLHATNSTALPEQLQSPQSYYGYRAYMDSCRSADVMNMKRRRQSHTGEISSQHRRAFPDVKSGLHDRRATVASCTALLAEPHVKSPIAKTLDFNAPELDNSIEVDGNIHEDGRFSDAGNDVYEHISDEQYESDSPSDSDVQQSLFSDEEEEEEDDRSDIGLGDDKANEESIYPMDSDESEGNVLALPPSINYLGS